MLTQDEINEYFAVADELRVQFDDTYIQHEPDVVKRRNLELCTGCGGTNVISCYADGCMVCQDCALVQSLPIYQHAVLCIAKMSNYKRIHHFHERITQFMLTESSIKPEDMERIKGSFWAGGYTQIDKTIVRKILRSLKMQHYIEKWLQIIWQIAGVRPPLCSQRVLMKLDVMFMAMQNPFARLKPESRKNFLNYNYVFARLFDLLGVQEYCCFFPLIKSRSKLQSLNNQWEAICNDLGWPVKPLVQIKPFAIKVQPSC